MGWRFAEVYRRRPYTMPDQALTELPPHLPGVGEMTNGQRAVALIFQIESALPACGIALTDLNKDATPQTLRRDIAKDNEDAEIQRDVLKLYDDVRGLLAARDPMLATAFGLGRMLADTCLLPTSKDAETYQKAFAPERLQNAYDWLDELSHRLPSTSAGTVKLSLQQWSAWAGQAAHGQAGQGFRSRPAPHYTSQSTRALREQGDLWRRLLGGEQKPDDLMDARSYEEAGKRVLTNARRIATSFLAKWWYLVVLAILAVAAVVGGIVWVSGSGDSNAVSLSLTGLAALGLTWKGVGSTLGQALSLAWMPMWDEELATARAAAVTNLPPLE